MGWLIFALSWCCPVLEDSGVLKVYSGDPQARRAQLTNNGLQVQPAAKVGQIFIVGHTRVPQNVIRNAVPLYPGQVLSYPDMRVAERNLARIGICKTSPNSSIEPKITVLNPDDPSPYKDLLVTVQEASIGSAMCGVGVNGEGNVPASAATAIEAKLDKILGKLEQIEKRLDAIEERARLDLVDATTVASSENRPIFRVLDQLPGTDSPTCPGFSIQLNASNSNARVRELLNESMDSGPIRYEWGRPGLLDHPSHLTPDRVEGGVQ